MAELDHRLAAPFTELVEVLNSVGVQASLDPADLNLPAVWIALDELRGTNLSGTVELRTRLFLVVPDTTPMRALEQLSDLHTKVTSVITPDGPTVTQGVVMPSDPTPLPGLAIPLYLYTKD